MARLGLLTMVRNEEALVGEFLAHHLGLGVSRVLVLDNGSTDGTRAVLDRVTAAEPCVSVWRWEGTHKAGFSAGIEALRGEADWVLAIDCDEFAVSTGDAALPDYLDTRAGDSAIGLHWAIFGSSGQQSPPRDLLTAQLARRGADDIRPNHHIKSLIRPERAGEALNSHVFALSRPEDRYVNLSGDVLDWWTVPGLARGAPVLEPFRLHHYFCRDRSFWDAKMRRAREASARIRNSVRTEADWVRHDRNEVADGSALRHLPATRAMLARLGLDPRGRLPGTPEPEPVGRSNWLVDWAERLALRAEGEADPAQTAFLQREVALRRAWASERGG